MQEDRARAVSVTEETAGGNRFNREPRNTLIWTYLRAVWMGRGQGKGSGDRCRACQGLHNAAFLPYVELQLRERSPAAFD